MCYDHSHKHRCIQVIQLSVLSLQLIVYFYDFRRCTYVPDSYGNAHVNVTMGGEPCTEEPVLVNIKPDIDTSGIVLSGPGVGDGNCIAYYILLL